MGLIFPKNLSSGSFWQLREPKIKWEPHPHPRHCFQNQWIFKFSFYLFSLQNFTDYYGSWNTSARCSFQSYQTEYYVIYLQIFNLFMFFWLINFMIALGQITLAGAFASYYWAFSKPSDVPAFPLFKSFWRAIRYGSCEKKKKKKKTDVTWSREMSHMSTIFNFDIWIQTTCPF